MKKRHEYSIELCGKIQILSKEGFTCFKNTGTNITRKHGGRPKCTSESEDKQIIVISKRNKRLPPTIIKEYLNQTRQTQISSDTVERRLYSAGLNSQIACRKPLL